MDVAILICPACKVSDLTRIYRVAVSDGMGRRTVLTLSGADRLARVEARTDEPDEREQLQGCDTVVLYGNCERCRADWAVSYKQHKGNTLIDWITTEPS